MEEIGTVLGSVDESYGESHEAKAFMLGWAVLGNIPSHSRRKREGVCEGWKLMMTSGAGQGERAGYRV